MREVLSLIAVVIGYYGSCCQFKFLVYMEMFFKLDPDPVFKIGLKKGIGVFY